MRYFKLFGLVLATVCAVGTLTATSAFALPTLLPESVTAFTGKGGATELVKANGTSIKCTSLIGEGTVEANRHLGEFHLHLGKCTTAAGLFTCTGLGEESGVRLFLVLYHFGFVTLKASLGEAGVAVLLLFNKSEHFECMGKLFIVPLGGMALCLILNPTALTKTFEFHCNKAEGNRPEETKYYNEEGTLVGISALLLSENEGTAEEATQVGLGTLEYSEAVLLMI